MFHDVFRGVADGSDLLGVLVRNLDREFLFEGHHQFHSVQRISSEVLDKAGPIGNLTGLNTPRRMEVVVDSLSKRGYTGDALEKIMGRNLYRIYAEVIG